MHQRGAGGARTAGSRVARRGPADAGAESEFRTGLTVGLEPRVPPALPRREISARQPFARSQAAVLSRFFSRMVDREAAVRVARRTRCTKCASRHATWMSAQVVCASRPRLGRALPQRGAGAREGAWRRARLRCADFLSQRCREDAHGKRAARARSHSRSRGRRARWRARAVAASRSIPARRRRGSSGGARNSRRSTRHRRRQARLHPPPRSPAN